MKVEYQTTTASGSAIGIDACLDLARHKPKGRGWTLINVSVVSNLFYYFWRRSVKSRVKKRCSTTDHWNILTPRPPNPTPRPLPAD